MTAPRYFSSRHPGGEVVPFREALLRGLAPDGGLYLPDRIPPLPSGWRELDSFADLAVAVLSSWLDEPPADELEALLRDALDFPVPLVALSDDRWVLELFGGPTLSFKDFGARTMARLMSYHLRRQRRRLLVLVATSGDTGSAVADGFAGQEGIEVVLLYPRGRVSEVQERQLVVTRPGVRTFAVEGSFDDCQRMVKEAFVDARLAHLPLSSANSINIGRLLPQALYHLWGVRELGRLAGAEIAPLVCVPSGNLGNLTGGVLAERMGLAVHRFVAAHNANDYFPEFLRGRADAYAFRPTVSTLSNAMDVGAPSNFERLEALLGGDALQPWGVSVDDAATRARLRATEADDGYLACPHTAVGLEGVARYRQETGDRTPALVLATAHPAKFPTVVAEALGRAAPTSEALEALVGRPSSVEPLAPTLEALRARLLD